MGGNIAGQLHPVDEHYDDRLDLDLDDKDCPPFHRPGCKGLAKGTPRGRLTL